MQTYLSIFKISFQEEFAYRLNFILWRARNVLQIFIAFYLWDTIFANPDRIIFGYDKAKILTYVFGLIIVRAFVLSSRTVDVAGEISRGELSNYLVKPINYFKYWLTRDLSSKALNLGFAFVEGVLLYLYLRPPFFVQTDPLFISGFLVAITIAMFIYFVLLFITSSVPFWAPEAAWGGHFLVTVIMVEFLSGALFPLDVLPPLLQEILSYTPFPYLIFFPLRVYLGQAQGPEIVRGVLIGGVWASILWLLMKNIWARGLKVYQAYGR